MNTDEMVLRLLAWMWANPWAILLAFVVIVAFALWARRILPPDYYYFRGMPRCYICTDATGNKNKVVYFDKESAEAAARRYHKKYGPQSAYPARCGFWHLTSQERRPVRGSRS